MVKSAATHGGAQGDERPHVGALLGAMLLRWPDYAQHRHGQRRSQSVNQRTSRHRPAQTRGRRSTIGSTPPSYTDTKTKRGENEISVYPVNPYWRGSCSESY